MEQWCIVKSLRGLGAASAVIWAAVLVLGLFGYGPCADLNVFLTMLPQSIFQTAIIFGMSGIVEGLQSFRRAQKDFPVSHQSTIE